MRYLLFLLLLVPFTAQAAENKPLNATYSLYAGGVRMIDVLADFNVSPKNYDVRVDAKTDGIFSKLLPWSGTFDTTGTAGYKPIKHAYAVRWMHDVQAATFNYEPAGVFKDMVKTENDQPTNEQVDPSIPEGTIDMLSALMTMMDTYTKTDTCNSDSLVFDNARSFIIRFRDVGDTTMENAKLSSYTGPAHGCSVEVIPQKGNWPKKPRGWLRIQQQAEGQLPIIWLAHPQPDLPVIPVRVDVHTKYGDVIAHLSGLQ